MSKSRTFIYEISSIYENIDEKIESLKQIDCRYHIIGFDKDSNGNNSNIKGFIWFNTPRARRPTIKLVGLDSVRFTEEDSFTIHKDISEMQSFWETGSLPKQSHARKKREENQLDSASKEIYNYLMKQNQQIFEKFFEDKQNLQDEKKQLQEELSKIKEENIRLKEREVLQNSLLIPQSINQTNTNSHNITNKNKTFNINMFLNEQCKDAITLSEFIQKIQIENEDLFYAKDHGYVDAMIRLLTNSLKQYTITERPLHCTDIKRETMHIKNERGWIKEKGSESEDMTNAIKSLSNKKSSKLYSK